jgi:hypothetical protein
MYKNRYHLKLLRSPATIPWNPQNDASISAIAAQTWLCRCERSQFQYFTIMYAWFAELPHCFRSGSASCDLLRVQTGSSLKRPSTGCRENGRTLPSWTFQYSQMLGVHCEGMHCHVEKSGVFSSGPCHEMHLAISGAPEHSELRCKFPFWAENQVICAPWHPRKVYS